MQVKTNLKLIKYNGFLNYYFLYIILLRKSDESVELDFSFIFKKTNKTEL
jgi:hypothetical protein